MLHSDLFAEFGCDGKLIDLPEQSSQILTVKRCEKCWTELSWIADDERWVKIVYPGTGVPPGTLPSDPRLLRCEPDSKGNLMAGTSMGSQ